MTAVSKMSETVNKSRNTSNSESDGFSTGGMEIEEENEASSCGNQNEGNKTSPFLYIEETDKVSSLPNSNSNDNALDEDKLKDASKDLAQPLRDGNVTDQGINEDTLKDENLVIEAKENHDCEEIKVAANKTNISEDFNDISNLPSNKKTKKSESTSTEDFQKLDTNQVIPHKQSNTEDQTKGTTPIDGPNKIISHGYGYVTADLQDKLTRYPDSTSVPFYVDHALPAIPQHNDNHWKWNHPDYVMLPINRMNGMPHTLKVTGNGEQTKWDIITNQLQRLKEACENKVIEEDLDKVIGAVIGAYCPDANQKTNFGILSRQELRNMLLKAIPIIVENALNLPKLLTGPIPILKSGQSKSIFLTRKLCSSLLANAFFCTFPESSGQQNTPGFNFFLLSKDTFTERSEVKKEKIKCILNYFIMLKSMDESFHGEVVSFERRYVDAKVDWENSTKDLCDVVVESDKKIEDAEGLLQVDFANKRIGGGVLSDGTVQEEIRFCISPELIVSRLFTEIMEDDEVVIITGSQIFSTYTGYHTSFKYAGEFDFGLGNRHTDKFGRTFTQVLALDAVDLRRYDYHVQFGKKILDRDLHKCSIGFTNGNKTNTAVATGNWGCGVFNGDIELKFIIQWMAASQQDRLYIQYHTWKDQKFSMEINQINSFLRTKNVQVGQLYKLLLKYNRGLGKKQKSSIFKFLQKNFKGNGSVGLMAMFGCGVRR